MKPSDKFWARSYANHRQRLREAKCSVDHQAPMVDIEVFFKPGLTREDANLYQTLMQNNQILLQRINSIMRTQGDTTTFCNNNYYCGGNRVRSMNRRTEEIEKENVEFYRMLIAAKCAINTRWDNEKISIPNRVVKKRPLINVPEVVMEKYNDLVSIPRTKCTERLMRPKVFIDLEIKDIRPMGRIFIQLYTEAAPQVVLEMVRCCSQNRKDSISICHIFPDLWINAAMELSPQSLCTKNIEYDMRAVNHSICGGILSFSKENCGGFTIGELNFAISFRPLNVLNGQRIAFGNVIKGLHLLACLQDFGSKNGKPIRSIVVTNCGCLY